MMTLKIIVFAGWLLAGILTLCNKNISKFEYAIAWSVLMVNLLGNIFGA